jgi:hypothetical protein
MPDRLSLANALADADIERTKAERIATEIYDAITGSVATKTDLVQLGAAVKNDLTQLDAKLNLIEHRLLTRLGGAITIATGILIAIKYLA